MSNTLSLSGIKGAALSGFKTERLKQAGFAILGSFATSYVSGKAYGMLGSVLPTSGVVGKAAKVGVTLLAAGAVGYAAKRALPGRANAILLGGLISGVVEGLSQVFPNQIKPMNGMGFDDSEMRGLGYDIADESGLMFNLNGGRMGDWNVGPRNASEAFEARQPLGRMGDVMNTRNAGGAIPMNGVVDFSEFSGGAMNGMGDCVTTGQVDHPAQLMNGMSYADSMVGEEIAMGG